MSDKYEEWARTCYQRNKAMFHSLAPIRGDGWRIILELAFTYCAAKLEEEREKETCENCVYAIIQRFTDHIEMLCHNPKSTMHNLDISEDCRCSKWSRRIVEKQSVIAPTSAGGTTKSIAVTPDE